MQRSKRSFASLLHSTVVCIVAGWTLLACGPDDVASTPLRPASAAPASSGGFLKLVRAREFLVYYGARVGEEREQLLKPPPHDIEYHAIGGPLSALDGKLHVIDIASPGPWRFLFSVPFADARDRVYIRQLQATAGDGSIKGALSIKGDRLPDSPLEASYDVHYTGVNPVVGGLLRLHATSGGVAQSQGNGNWK